MIYSARGAGIADFIQPSLGPLQPNLDDIDLTIDGKRKLLWNWMKFMKFRLELLQTSRLPTVPEEDGTEDILKSVDYAIDDILGA